jgi:cobalt-zinc-cadmium efflux system protein
MSAPHSHDHSHAGHDHSHGGHGHSHAPKSFNKAFAIAIAITSAYVIAEVIYGFMANSMTLLADAAHNLGDVLGLGLAWLANWLLSFPARKRYSYGFKRTTIIASLINAFILVATSALIAYESIYKLFHLQQVDEMTVVIVGVVGILVNGGCALLFMRGSEGDLNIRSAFWHLFADMLILVGVVVSAALIHFTGLMWIDPAMGLLIVAIVLWGTWGLLRDSTHLMLDAIPRYIDQHAVQKYLADFPGVKAVHDLHIWGLSTREVALTAHLIMPETPLTDEDHKKINDEMLHHYKINHVTIQVETSLDDSCVRSEMC